jgi:hypothetical protein
MLEASAFSGKRDQRHGARIVANALTLRRWRGATTPIESHRPE